MYDSVRQFDGWAVNDRVETDGGIATIGNIMVPESGNGPVRVRVMYETGGCEIVRLSDLREPEYAGVTADCDSDDEGGDSDDESLGATCGNLIGGD